MDNNGISKAKEVLANDTDSVPTFWVNKYKKEAAKNWCGYSLTSFVLSPLFVSCFVCLLKVPTLFQQGSLLQTQYNKIF
jgi:hypothetical protein